MMHLFKIKCTQDIFSGLDDENRLNTTPGGGKVNYDAYASYKAIYKFKQKFTILD